MIRKPRRNEREIEAALRAAVAAVNLAELRLYQSILIPALTGASLDATAEILGLSRSRVCLLRRQFRAGINGAAPLGKRGGRRRALMTLVDEERFVMRWLEALRGPGAASVAEMHVAYQAAVGRTVPKSTVYRLLARHGWRPA
jgi:hypothetical protein